MDDIDKVFKKKKKGPTSGSKKQDDETTENHAPEIKDTPKDLLNVLDAIDATNKSKSKKKKRSKDKDGDEEKKKKKKRKFEAQSYIQKCTQFLARTSDNAPSTSNWRYDFTMPIAPSFGIKHSIDKFLHVNSLPLIVK